MGIHTQQSIPWWGDFKFAIGETRVWSLGPMRMWVSRANSEFRVSVLRDPANEESLPQIGELDDSPIADDAETVRYGVREATRKLNITPAIADRSAIVKAESSFIVPPEGAVTAFVSTPVWLQVRLPGSDFLMHEDATFRLSDTWFGQSTIEGELCYAVRTSVRFHLENLPLRPNRAISVVRILNHADTPLPLARLRLPLRCLSIFAAENGRLWTEALILDRRGNNDLAEIKLGDSAPHEAGQCLKVADPREQIGKRNPIRSFTSLFGLGKGGETHERVVE